MRSKGFLVERLSWYRPAVGGVSLSNFVTVNGRGVGEILLGGAVFGVHRVDLAAFLPFLLAHEGYLLAVRRVGGRGIERLVVGQLLALVPLDFMV